MEQLHYQWLALLEQERKKSVVLTSSQDAKQDLMEAFYKDLTKEKIIDVIYIIREQSAQNAKNAVDKNSIHWVNQIIEFFRTGDEPTVSLEGGALKRMKASSEPIVLEVRSDDLALLGNPTQHYNILDAQGNIGEIMQ